MHLLVPSLKETLEYVQLANDEISARALQPSVVFSVVEPVRIENMTMISVFKLAALIAFAWCVYIGGVLVLLAMKLRSPVDK